MAADIDVLLAEYNHVATRVHTLAGQLEAATRERDTILAALTNETGLTHHAVCELTGLTITRLRTALHNHWLHNHKSNRPASSDRTRSLS